MATPEMPSNEAYGCEDVWITNRRHDVGIDDHPAKNEKRWGLAAAVPHMKTIFAQRVREMNYIADAEKKGSGKCKADELYEAAGRVARFIFGDDYRRAPPFGRRSTSPTPRSRMPRRAPGKDSMGAIPGPTSATGASSRTR